jgi:hypothetical protein
MNADSCLEGLPLHGKISNFFDHAKTGFNGTTRIVFVRQGITEIRKDSVPQELADIATEPFDDAAATILICKYELSQVFRVLALGQLSGADEVTE